MKRLATFLIFIACCASSAEEIVVVRTDRDHNWGWGEERLFTGKHATRLVEFAKQTWLDPNKIEPVLPAACIVIHKSNHKGAPFEVNRTYWFYHGASVKGVPNKATLAALRAVLADIDKPHPSLKKSKNR
jgi:hypothetical protein